MRRQVGPAHIAGALVGLVVVAGIVLYLVPSNNYLLLPDRAHAVAPLVRVQGAHPARGPGGIYFVDIFVRKASLLERLWPGIHEGAELVPKSAILAPGASEQDRKSTRLNSSHTIQSRMPSSA